MPVSIILACIGDFNGLTKMKTVYRMVNDAGLSDMMVILYDDQDNQVEIFVSNASKSISVCDLEPGILSSANPKSRIFSNHNRVRFIVIGWVVVCTAHLPLPCNQAMI